MASVVTVLTPNGRRQNVKVPPNKTVLQILDEVCQKHNFQSSEYDLRHHKRVLDLTLMFRFTGLPNNAQLEMVKAPKQRQETEVILMIQFEDGSRKSDSFQPDVTLMDVLCKLCPDKSSEDDLVLIYMRTDIHGSDLSTTTLKSLGLKGGRAMLRLVQRKVDSLKTQANVSRVITVSHAVKSEDSKLDPNTVRDVMEVSEVSSDNLQNVPSTFERLEQTPSPENNDRKRAKIDSTIESKLIASTSNDHPETSTNVEIVEEPVVIEIGERQAILFTLNGTEHVDTDVEVKDSFFDLTVNDIKVLLRDLRTQTQELENAPLMTSKMRELEHDNQTMLKLNRYRTTVIRIQFPNRMVLQGRFLPSDSIAQVMDFVRNFLIQPEMEFHLYTTPPKTILEKESYLVENHCVPMALLHFGTNESCDPTKNFVKDEFLAKMSSYRAAIWTASKTRGLNFAALRENESESADSGSTSSNRKQQSASNHPPGWNDPPTFNYSNAPPPTKTKLNLNKRIAFPIQSSTKSTELPKVEKSGGGLPMPFARVKQNPEQLNLATASSYQPPQFPPSITKEAKKIEIDNQQVLAVPQEDELTNSHEFVTNSLNEIIKSLMPSDSLKIEEIDRRLHILDTMWTEGKINDKLKLSLVQIVKALQDKLYTSAIDIHRSTIVDHGSVICAQWGPALRQLILLKENETKIPEIVTDACTVDEPKFIDTVDEESDKNKKHFGRVIHL